MLTMRKDRGHEQHEIEDIGDVVSDFNNLPDCIIHHILSLMPTKEAVKTSILSTRWKNLWAFVPNIDFDDIVLCAKEVDDIRRPDVTSFMNFVERALRLRGESNIKKFRLSCSGRYETSQIRSWISYAIMHNVQELDLNLGANPSMIPWSILNTTSLVSLKIANNFVTELPSCISFPCLKTLHLFLVVFPDNDHAEKLLLGCPVLEELVLLDTWENLNNIVISSSTLKSLFICDWSFFDTLDGFSGCKINIDAANLTYFEYRGCLLNEIILNNTPSLDKAFIHVSNYEEGVKEVAYRAVDLLKQLQYVVSLRLSNETMEFLLFADANNIRFPVFTKLTHLMLTMEIRMSDTFEVLMGFLSFCPVLQSISFSEGCTHGMDLRGNKPIWLSIPTCISNNLKTVSLKDFHGYDSEIHFLKRVLKYACVLETVDICCSKTYLQDLESKTKAIKELEKIERCSKACVIKFS